MKHEAYVRQMARFGTASTDRGTEVDPDPWLDIWPDAAIEELDVAPTAIDHRGRPILAVAVALALTVVALGSLGRDAAGTAAVAMSPSAQPAVTPAVRDESEDPAPSAPAPVIEVAQSAEPVAARLVRTGSSGVLMLTGRLSVRSTVVRVTLRSASGTAFAPQDVMVGDDGRLSLGLSTDLAIAGQSLDVTLTWRDPTGGTAWQLVGAVTAI